MLSQYQDKEKFRIFFSELEFYEDMEILAQKFVDNLNAKVIDKLDGPYSRIWFIEIDIHLFKLIIDESYGSSIVAEKAPDIDALKELMPLIEKFIH